MMIKWFTKRKNQRLLKSFSIKIPLSSDSYSKNACLQIEEGARFNRVSFHCRNLEIGMHSYMHSGELYMVSKIGRYCSIAERVIIGVDPAGHPLNWLSTHPFQYSKKYLSIESPLTYEGEWSDVVIGNDVWIGQEVIIMKGVKIGNGAVIGARSIVTQDIPDYAIAVGIPAKIIKYRFSEEIIKELKHYPWWQLPESSLKGISFDNISTSLEQLSKEKFDKSILRRLEVVINKKNVFLKGD